MTFVGQSNRERERERERTMLTPFEIIKRHNLKNIMQSIVSLVTMAILLLLSHYPVGFSLAKNRSYIST
jgi:hypothetical protein